MINELNIESGLQKENHTETQAANKIAEAVWGSKQGHEDTNPGHKLVDLRPFPFLWYEPKGDDTNQKKDLLIDLGGRHHDVIVSITLPDGGKISRVTEELPWSKGSYVLKGYKMPDGTLVEKDLHRNTDGSISVLDIDVENRHPDRHEQRLSEEEFIDWAKEQQKH